MGWWSAGGEAHEVVGDDSADAVARMLAGMPEPGMQEFLNALAAALQATGAYSFHRLRARLSNGREMESGPEADAELVRLACQGVDSVIEVYRDQLDRPPTLREVLENSVFILGYQPDRYLSGMEGIEVKDLRFE